MLYFLSDPSHNYSNELGIIKKGLIESAESVRVSIDDVKYVIWFTYSFKYENEKIQNGIVNVAYDEKIIKKINAEIDSEIIERISDEYSCKHVLTNFKKAYYGYNIVVLTASKKYNKIEKFSCNFSGTTNEYIDLVINGKRHTINFKLTFSYDWSNGIHEANITVSKFDFGVTDELNDKIKDCILKKYPFVHEHKRITTSHDMK